MAGGPTLTLTRTAFDGRARADLARIASDTAADLEDYRDGIAAGQMQCIGVVVDGARRGTAVVSWLDEGALALVVNAAAVDVIDGRDMTRELFECFHAWAKARGAGKIRFWTARRGLAVKASELGFRAIYVMEKDDL